MPARKETAQPGLDEVMRVDLMPNGNAQDLTAAQALWPKTALSPKSQPVTSQLVPAKKHTYVCFLYTLLPEGVDKVSRPLVLSQHCPSSSKDLDSLSGSTWYRFCIQAMAGLQTDPSSWTSDPGDLGPTWFGGGGR